jgi:hypothetical protein
MLPRLDVQYIGYEDLRRITRPGVSLMVLDELCERILSLLAV